MVPYAYHGIGNESLLYTHGTDIVNFVNRKLIAQIEILEYCVQIYVYFLNRNTKLKFKNKCKMS